MQYWNASVPFSQNILNLSRFYCPSSTGIGQTVLEFIAILEIFVACFDMIYGTIQFSPRGINMKYIPPNPENGSLAEVIEAMESAPAKKVYVRLQAIRFLFMGHKPSEAAHFVLRST